MKNIVVYYSRKGSNRFLASRISQSLGCELLEIRPRINTFFLFLFNFNPGIRRMKKDFSQYDRVIMCGPIWMGRFIPPLRGFVRRYKNQIKDLIFVTCCGSTYEKSEEKFGHGLVFKQVKSSLDGKCSLCQAFPVGMVLPPEKREDPNAFMENHLNNENFKGDILDIFNSFIEKLKVSE